MIIRRDDGRYAHVPGCNERCGNGSHWLEQSVPAPWQQQPPAAGDVLYSTGEDEDHG